MADVTGSFTAGFTFTPGTAGAKTTFSGFDAGFVFSAQTVAHTNSLSLSVDSPGTLTLSVDTPGGLNA